MKPHCVQPGTLRFIIIAIIFMLVMDQFVFGGKRSYIENAKTATAVEHQEEVLAQAPEPEATKELPTRVEPPSGEFFEQVPEDPEIAKVPEPKIELEKPKLSGAKIAIIIDDLGMDVKHTKEVIDLPAPVTLAFLPYAPRARELAASAKTKGHELIIHTPMEAMDGSLNIGPGGLKAGMGAAEFQAAFGKMLGSFDGYVGINNHMGSRLTQDKTKMDALMNMLAQKDLFFVDSKTIESSVAAHEAAAAGVRYAERDVFLDHVETPEFVTKALRRTEELALRRGHAIAIGHPKSFTIAGLKAWLPTLAEKGIEVVPVSRLLVKPQPVVEVKEEVVPASMPEPLPMPAPEAAPMEATPPQGTETPAPSVDMFPEAIPSTPNGLSGSATSTPVQSILPPPTQSPAP